MTELATTLKQLERVGEKAFERAIGFQDGRRYCEMILTMKEVKNVGENNREYVKSLISVSEIELRKISEIYGESLSREGEKELDRLTKLLNN